MGWREMTLAKLCATSAIENPRSRRVVDQHHAGLVVDEEFVFEQIDPAQLSVLPHQRAHELFEIELFVELDVTVELVTLIDREVRRSAHTHSVEQQLDDGFARALL